MMNRDTFAYNYSIMLTLYNQYKNEINDVRKK